MQGGPAAPTPRHRQRISTSCTECRRRKQKCNQAKDRPCNNCARRYPPVACIYETSKKTSTVERIIELQVTNEEEDEANAKANATAKRSDQFVQRDARFQRTIPVPSNLALVISDQDYSGPISNPYSPLYMRSFLFPLQSLKKNITPSRASDELQLNREVTTNEKISSDAEQAIEGPVYFNTYFLSRGRSPNGDPKAFIGRTMAAIDTMNVLPIEGTRRNAELFHFFHQTLVPYIATIDGEDPPLVVAKEWIPWMVQSPLMSNMSILSSSCFQAEARGLEVARCPETIGIKVKAISIINDYLRKNFKEIHNEVIVAVNHLAINEWYWGEEASVWAHMRGLKEMLRLRGGLENLPKNEVLRQTLALTDYQIACTFERDLFLHKKDSNPNEHLPQLREYPVNFHSPLLQTNLRFLEISDTLGINKGVAEILDDMAVLSDEKNRLDESKFRATALWTHNRLLSLPPPPPSTSNSSNHTPNAPPPAVDYVYESCRIVALMYSYAIVSRSPLSKSSTEAQMAELWSKMWRVPLSKWKALPGVFLWIVLVACPCARDKVQARFLKRMLATIAMYVGVLGSEMAMWSFKEFLRLQNWIARGGGEQADRQEVAQRGSSLDGDRMSGNSVV